jgi:hypothetical protein
VSKALVDPAPKTLTKTQREGNCIPSPIQPKILSMQFLNFDHKLPIPCFLINGQQLSDQPFGNLLFTLDHPMSFHTVGQLSKLDFSFSSFFLCKFNFLHKNLSRRISPL